MEQVWRKCWPQMDDPNRTLSQIGPNLPRKPKLAATPHHFCDVSHFSSPSLSHPTKHFHTQTTLEITVAKSEHALPLTIPKITGRNRSKHFLAQPALQDHGSWQTSKHTLSSSSESTAFLSRRIFLSSRIFLSVGCGFARQHMEAVEVS